MSRLKNKKPNIPKALLENYVWLIAGIPKAGKTTLFAKLIEQYYGDVNAGLLLAFEKGYQALRVTAEDVNEWDDFEEIVDELIEEKDNLPYKFIGLDTADYIWEYSQTKTIQEWNSKNPAKRTSDIAGVGAKGKSDQGFGVGFNTAKQKIRTQVDRLIKAGYGVMILTHSKDKEVEQKDGLKYDQLAISLSSSARDVFVNMADFIVFITIEKEKDEDDNIQTKRYMYFRTDGYVEAGSRFKNVPERIEYDVTEFINVFENAVKSEFGDEVDMKEIKKEQKVESDKQSKAYVEKEKAKMKPKELINSISELIQPLEKDDPKKKEIAAVFKEIAGVANYTKVTDTSLLEEMLEKTKEIVQV